MGFFTNPDWFNRPGPYAFTLEHFLFIIISAIIGIIAALLLRKVSPKTLRIVLICLWASVVFIDAFKWTIQYSLMFIYPDTYKFSLEQHLPLHSCSMFMYICPIALFSKNQKLRVFALNFLVTVNMIMGFITMFVGFSGKHASVFSFFGLHTLLYHALIFIIPLIMLVTGYYKPKVKDIKYGLATFLALGTVVLIFDIITKCDYMYFYDGHTFGVFKFIYENVPHFSIWTTIVVSCYIITAIATHFLVIGIAKLVEIIKEKRSS